MIVESTLSKDNKTSKSLTDEKSSDIAVQYNTALLTLSPKALTSSDRIIHTPPPQLFFLFLTYY